MRCLLPCPLRIILLCLSIWNRSPIAYHELRSSGMLVLPSGTLLQMYKNSVKQEPGFNKEVFELMRDEANKRNVGAEGRFGGIMLDEMAIQEDVQLKQENGVMRLVGVVDTGDEDSYMRAIQSGKTSSSQNHLK